MNLIINLINWIKAEFDIIWWNELIVIIYRVFLKNGFSS